MNDYTIFFCKTLRYCAKKDGEAVVGENMHNKGIC